MQEKEKFKILVNCPKFKMDADECVVMKYSTVENGNV